MTATILYCRRTTTAIRTELADRGAPLAGRGAVPGLGTVLVGDVPGSHAYIAGKHRDCAQTNITSIGAKRTSSMSGSPEGTDKPVSA